jgi:nicotinamidase/pyrazinamidase
MTYNINPEHDALIVVDVQNDFLPGGTLPVNDGLQVIPLINRLLPMFNHVYYTRDWHPPNHVSFAEFPKYADKSWPPHAVMDTPGAEFHNDLFLPEIPHIFNKGNHPDREAYSGFQDTKLEVTLHAEGINRVFVCGLATDYCVKHTVLDGLKLGFAVVLLEDAVRGVDYPPGSAPEAILEMQLNGAVIRESSELVPPLPELLLHET